MTFHYTDSGLDNIYLENGYQIHETQYGKGVSIQDTAELHQAIGRWLVSLPKPLNGAELRFLRLELDMTQRNLAGALGIDEQRIRRWEKAREKSIDGAADRLLRILFLEYNNVDSKIRSMVDRLSKLDKIDRSNACFHDTEQGWQLAA